MLRKWTSLISVILVLVLSNNLFADTDWTGAVSSDWYNAANWTGIVPNDSERTLVQSLNPLTWPVIDGGNTSTERLTLAHNGNMLGELTVTGDATLNINGELRVARNSDLGQVATLFISGEDTTINVTERIECGRYGDGTIDMSGGYLHCDAELRLAFREEGSSKIFLRGGTIDLAANPGITVFAGDGVPGFVLIDISGGTFTLAGNQVPDIETLISDGTIIGYGGEGTVSVTFDGATNTTMVVGIGGPSASEPDPADEQPDVPRDVILRWKSGTGAVTNDVYFGMSFDDVEQATTTVDPGSVYRGNINTNTYTVTERLEFNKTYYWRVDAVNASNTVNKGDVWSFKAEQLAYPVENIIVTASSSEEGKGPENTINGSGLDDTGLLHTNDSVGNMWLSSGDGIQPTWIEYEFDRAYKLHEMWVWNSNDSLESLIGLGFKEVLIEYSANGIDFVTLGTTHEFTKALGTPDYEHDTTIDFGGVAAKHIRLTANSNWGGIFNQFGLSEVRFFQIPVHSRVPGPASRATELDLDLSLRWQPGREVAKHDVYFSSDEQAVIDGTAPVTTLTQTNHGPLNLNLGTTYYWRVDEVNDAETPSSWQGDIWSFTTQEFLVVDDFESYNDLHPDDPESNRIFNAWLDGFDNPEINGSVVGHTDAPFAEQTIVHSGSQSMPYIYDNNMKYSEATMTLTSLRDWTVSGAEELSLWFRGLSASQSTFTEDPPGTYTMTARSDNIADPSDSFHYVYKQLTGSGSIIVKVESVTETSTSAKAGVMIRESLEPDSAYAMVFSRPDGGTRFRRRNETAGETTNSVDSNLAVPHWVKLERDAAGLLTASHSTDGVNFVPLEDQNLGSSDTVQMNNIAFIGLALSSNNPEETCTAVFSEVSTAGTITGQWQSQDIGIESNDPESMYVAIANSAGTPAVVYHDDPDAAATDIWTHWVIPLQKFADQGVNLTNIDSIAIGFGDKNNLQPGGSGIVFFDDIGVGRSAP
ncbi:MAG: discoidin domain-containing protein [Planctomycetes bacterium]|nr:discoidin domain-containing protein [Planctomycetota bacterium]